MATLITKDMLTHIEPPGTPRPYFNGGKHEKLLKSTKKKVEKATCVNPADETLFEELRKKRLEIAKQLEVASFIIFHDSTLREMAVDKPSKNQGPRR